MANAGVDLAPPTSGLPLEVSFRRLLKSCEEVIAGDDKGRSDYCDWATSPAFHAAIETLQEQFADLQNIAGNRIDAEVLQAYDGRVEGLAKRLLPVSSASYCKGLSTSGRLQPVANAAVPISDAGPDSRGAPTISSSLTQPDLRQRKGSRDHLHASTQERLDRHQNLQTLMRREASTLQDSLTDEMVALAASLRRNAQAMQNAVNRRGGLLDDAEDAVEDSLQQAKRSSKESQALRLRGSMTLCAILAAICLVSFVFVGTYIFIKSTSFLGYKARPR